MNIQRSALRQQPVSKRDLAAFFDALAPQRAAWIRKSAYFYRSDRNYLRFLIPAGQSVLEVGCGNGHLLAALEPALGVGIDISPGMVEAARAASPHLTFICADIEDRRFSAGLEGPFDAILLSDTIGHLEDCQATFRALHRLLEPQGRIVIAYYQKWYQPLLRLAERLKLKMPQLRQNWLTSDDIMNLLELADFEPVRREWRQLLPLWALGLGPLVNSLFAPLPGIRRLCLRHYVVARPVAAKTPMPAAPSASVIVPCRNERGNIEAAITRMPRFSPDQEIIFVEGNSRDGTYEECCRVRDAHPEWDIKVLQQTGRGKGDAVRLGLSAARGDIVMILDADLTVAPEDLPKFYEALCSGRGEMINGTRLVYAMDKAAMRPLNFVANRGFALVFSYLLNQRFTDALCGTKALWRRDYERIAANRAYFGELDPFGDFDLLFGAAKLSLRIVDMPVRYGARTYGETQISRFADGWLLARMVVRAWAKLKAL